MGRTPAVAAGYQASGFDHYTPRNTTRASTAFTPLTRRQHHQRVDVQLCQVSFKVHGEMRHAHQGIRERREVRRWPSAKARSNRAPLTSAITACASERVIGQRRRATSERLGFPVGLKVDSPDIPHKTEGGIVRLNLGDMAKVRTAYAEILVLRRIHTIHQTTHKTTHRANILPHRRRPVPMAEIDPGLRACEAIGSRNKSRVRHSCRAWFETRLWRSSP